MAKRISKKSLSVYDFSITPWVICLLAAVFYSYDYFLRVQPSVMIRDLMHFFSTNAVGIGFLSAFYYYAYTPLQIPAGLIIDRYSTRMVLTISVFLCVLGAFVFALVNHYPVALIARALMGIGSAFAFIGALKLGALWLPQKHYALFTGITTGLGTVGAMFTDTILSRMVGRIGWQETVLVTAYIGIVIGILIMLIVRNKPNNVKPLPREFRSWSHTWHRLIFMAKSWRFWINGIVGGLLFLPINVFASLWGVGFLRYGYYLTDHHAATAISLVFLGTAIGSPLAGWISDRIKKRKTPLFVGCGFATLLTLAILYETNVSELTLYIMLFLLGLFVGSQVLVFSIAREISPPRTTGTATAGTNFLVTAGAAIFQPFIGYLLVKFWQGSMTPAGIPRYSLATYRDALIVLPILLAIAFLLVFLLPETNCKLQHKHLKKRYH